MATRQSHCVSRSGDRCCAPASRRRNPARCETRSRRLALQTFATLGAIAVALSRSPFDRWSLLWRQLIALGLGLTLALHGPDLILKRALRFGCRASGVLPIVDGGWVVFARVRGRVDCVLAHAGPTARPVPRAREGLDADSGEGSGLILSWALSAVNDRRLTIKTPEDALHWRCPGVGTARQRHPAAAELRGPLLQTARPAPGRPSRFGQAYWRG